MDGLITRKGQHSTAPICLLYMNADNNLVPIAIQLKQKEGEGNPIFLPSDHLIDWLLAKIYYQSAHAQVFRHCSANNYNRYDSKLRCMRCMVECTPITYFVGPRLPIITSLPYDDPPSSHSQQFAYNNFGC